MREPLHNEERMVAFKSISSSSDENEPMVDNQESNSDSDSVEANYDQNIDDFITMFSRKESGVEMDPKFLFDKSPGVHSSR